MDCPPASRELVVGEAAAGQGLEAGLLEIVEMHYVVNVPEGVQLVGASVDYRFCDAQDVLPAPPACADRGLFWSPTAVIASTTPVTAPSAFRRGVEITSTGRTVPSLSMSGAPCIEYVSSLAEPSSAFPVPSNRDGE